MKPIDLFRNLLFLWPTAFLLLVGAPMSLSAVSKYDDIILSAGVAVAFFIGASFMGYILFKNEESKGNPVKLIHIRKEDNKMYYVVEFVSIALVILFAYFLYKHEFFEIHNLALSFPLLIAAFGITSFVSICINGELLTRE